MDIFSALADQNRRRIVELIATKGELSASDISHNFKISSPAISQHLKILRDAKVVDVEKRAQQRIYSINPTSIEQIEMWTQQLKTHWNKRFERLDMVLKSKGGGK